MTESSSARNTSAPQPLTANPATRTGRLRKRIGDRLRHIEIDIADLTVEFARLDAEEASADTAPPRGAAGPGRSRDRPRPPRGAAAPGDGGRLERILRAQAKIGVRRVELDGQGRRWKVLVEGHPTVPLPSGLADLVKLLIEDQGPSADHKVGWKTPAELAWRLGKIAGTPVSTHAVAERVRRLRRVLARAGVNEYLVETSRRLGYRFALHRPRGGTVFQAVSRHSLKDCAPAGEATEIR